MPRDEGVEEMGGDAASDELRVELRGVPALFESVPALLLYVQLRRKINHLGTEYLYFVAQFALQFCVSGSLCSFEARKQL